jgi:hypothetical protein
MIRPSVTKNSAASQDHNQTTTQTHPQAEKRPERSELT